MEKIRVEIDVHYVPTGLLVGTGVQWLADENEFELLKDLLSESVRGGHAFLKLANAQEQHEVFIGRETLIKSKITLRRCETEQK